MLHNVLTTSWYFVSHPSRLSWHWYAISLAMTSSWRCWTCQHQPLRSQKSFLNSQKVWPKKVFWARKILILFSGIILQFPPGIFEVQHSCFASWRSTALSCSTLRHKVVVLWLYWKHGKRQKNISIVTLVLVGVSQVILIYRFSDLIYWFWPVN